MAAENIGIYSPDGRKVGYFENPSVQMLPEHYYIISGRFLDPEGNDFPKVPFNPQVLPYTADLSGCSQCTHKKLVNVYVQRGRQPVEMTGNCPD